MPSILSVYQALIEGDQVSLKYLVLRVYFQVMMVGRGLQPLVGVKTDLEDLIRESAAAASVAVDLETEVMSSVPGWNEEVTKPISEAAATIGQESHGPGDLRKAREKLLLASSPVRAAAAQIGLDTFLTERLRQFYMRLTTIERGLHPYVGAKTEVSDLKDEVESAWEMAATLSKDL